MPKITVATSTYNRPNLLKRAIESVLNQSFEDFEYIIFNNGSTDNTQNIIDYYTSQDSRIICISNPSNKVVGTIPSLYSSENGSLYLTTLDDDDYIHRNMLSRLYSIAAETNSDISTVGSQFFYADGSKKDKFVYNDIYTLNRVDAMSELLKRQKINSAMGGKLYKKALFVNLELPNLPRIRDIHREYRTMNNIKQMTLTGEPMYYYYRHANNLSGLDTKLQITQQKMQEHLYANELRTEWLSKHMPEISGFVSYSEYSFMISLYERILRLNVEACHDIAKVMKQRLLNHKQALLNNSFTTDREKIILLSII